MQMTCYGYLKSHRLEIRAVKDASPAVTHVIDFGGTANIYLNRERLAELGRLISVELAKEAA